MNELDHSTLVAKYREGKLAFGMDPAHARRLFTDFKGETLISKIGEDLRFERFLVTACMAISWWGFLSTLPVAIMAFGWWAVAAIPAATVIWFGLKARAGMGRQSLFFEVTALATAIVVPPMAGWDVRTYVWLVLLAASLLAARLVYYFSSRMIKDLILRNPKAYDLLSRDIRVKEIGQ
jgi:hypothetical protein